MVFQLVKNLPANAGDTGDAILGSGRSPGEENGNPCQYSCMENAMDRRDWQATAHRVQRVGLDWVTNIFTFCYKRTHTMEKMQ